MNTAVFLHIDLRVLLDQQRERRVARGLGDQQKAVENLVCGALQWEI